VFVAANWTFTLKAKNEKTRNPVSGAFFASDAINYDPEKGRIKRGAGGKEAGTPRRLMDFFRQIELNYDLQSVSESRFWDMIPAEFSKFKNT
jgi:hypothetical protein